MACRISCNHQPVQAKAVQSKLLQTMISLLFNLTFSFYRTDQGIIHVQAGTKQVTVASADMRTEQVPPDHSLVEGGTCEPRPHTVYWQCRGTGKTNPCPYHRTCVSYGTELLVHLRNQVQ